MKQIRKFYYGKISRGDFNALPSKYKKKIDYMGKYVNTYTIESPDYEHFCFVDEDKSKEWLDLIVSNKNLEFARKMFDNIKWYKVSVYVDNEFLVTYGDEQ